jgi:hypothetical protein
VLARCFRVHGTVVGGLIASALWSSAAHGASVSWNAPASCPGRGEVLDRIEAARDRPLTMDPQVLFTATVTEEPSGRLTLTVHTRAGEGEVRAAPTRSLQAAECEELVAALVQIVSLALGPAVTRESAETEGSAPGSETARGTESTPEKTAEPPDEASGAEPTKPWTDVEPAALPPLMEERARVGLLGVLDTASFGDASLGVHLEAGISLTSAFELRGALGYVPPHAVAGVPRDRNAGGRFSLALAAALACVSWSSRPWRLPFCAGLEGGRWAASGVGVSRPQSDSVAWFAGRAEALIGFSLGGGLRANLLGGLVVPLVRHEFLIVGAQVHRIPALSLRAGMGLEYEL